MRQRVDETIQRQLERCILGRDEPGPWFQRAMFVGCWLFETWQDIGLTLLALQEFHAELRQAELSACAMINNRFLCLGERWYDAELLEPIERPTETAVLSTVLDLQAVEQLLGES